jgi:Tol biopolymer transport system component
MRHGRSGMKLAKFFIPMAVAIGFATALVCTASAVQSSSDHKVLFEKAKFTMETKGDLKGAINLFEEIIKKYPNERDYAAKSLYLIGVCYEKLGERQSQQAQAAFQRLVKDYPDQTDAVNMAKERLARLTASLEKAAPGPAFRKIRIPFELSEWSGGQLSPDGKTFAFGSENRLWVVPVQGKVQPDLAGEPVEIQGTEDAWAYGMSWSGDGRWIALNSENNESEYISVVPASGGKPKRIPVQKNRAGGVAGCYSISLSPDGKTIAFASHESKEIKKSQIFVVSVDGGDPRQLTKEGGIGPCYSPDGSKIAYVTPPINQENNVPKNDVWVMPAAGGNPVRVSNLPGQASSPIWSPDGKMVAFSWNEEWSSFKKEICIVSVPEEGKPLGSPLRINTPFETEGTFDPLLRWTTDNKIGILLNNPTYEAIYTVPASGGMALQITPSGYAIHPQWSPDGRRIYFRWDGGSMAFVPSGGGKLELHPSIVGGMHSDFFVSYPGGGNSLSPDGKMIVFSGAKRVSKIRDNLGFDVNIYTVPTEGGEPKKISNIERPDQARYPCWSPDGNWIAYQAGKVEEGRKYNVIFKVPSEGGPATEITAEQDKVQYAYFDWSPDGKSIAYFSTEGTLNVKSIHGGQPLVVCKVQDIDDHSDLSWSPDGQKIAFVSKGKIWVVSTAGGEPVALKTDVDARADKLDWSPDGQKIAFTGVSGGEKELWLMEDFLPLVKK